MYLVVRRYRTNPGSVDEVIQQVTHGFIPIISTGPGFIAYYLSNEGNGVLVSTSVFEDQASAEATNQLAADWIRQNLQPLLPTPPIITAGEVVGYKTR